MTSFIKTIKNELALRGAKNVTREEIEYAMLARIMLADLATQILYNRLGNDGENPEIDG